MSVSLAKLLRYQGPRKHCCDENGWMRIDEMLAQIGRGAGSRGGTEGSEEDIKIIVQESYTKDQPRFESEKRGDGFLYVRARAGEEYRRRKPRVRQFGGCNGLAAIGNHPWAPRAGPVCGRNGMAAIGGRPCAPSVSGQEWDENCPRQSSSMVDNAITSCDFNGFWRTKDGVTCSIDGTQLVWLGLGVEVTQLIEVKCDEIFLYEASEDKLSAKGKINYKGKIEWNDGDVWNRVQPETDTGCTNSGFPAVGSITATIHNGHETNEGSVDATPAIEGSVVVEGQNDGEQWMIGLGHPEERHAAGDWNGVAYGPEYLNLVSGELLLVQPMLEERWAYGYSVQRNMYGWLPPSYVKPALRAHADQPI